MTIVLNVVWGAALQQGGICFNIISARGRSIGGSYIHFRHENVELGSGTIAIGFGSKFRADSRHPDPEIFVLMPFLAFVHHFPKIEIEMFETLFEHMNFSWLLWPNRLLENERIVILYFRNFHQKSL
jgi:hypothetical protein